ncbi:acid protease [Peniophora sp. CONT]|nr:acid protease [Peniophora sp. CONT]
MLGPSLLLGVASFAAQSAFALRIPARSVPLPRRALSFSSDKGFKSRPVSNAATSTDDDGSTSFLVNSGDNIYLANVTLGGSQFTVQLDTGSTDLVLVPDKHIETKVVLQDHQPNSTYGTGWMSGPVAFAELQFGNYSVEYQAYLNGTSESFFDVAFFPYGIRGIMGVSLDSALSYVHNALDEVYGKKGGKGLSRGVLGNVFAQHPELDNFTTVYLGRTGDGEGTDEGIFTIGEYVDGAEDLMKDIKSIDVFKPTSWAVPLDAVTVNGKKIALNSSVKGAPSGKAIANLDTGTSRAGVPRYVLDAMYSAFDGAWYSDDQETWVVPCLNGAPNITFTFGGEDFYIHPLDLTIVNDLTNYTVCTPAFNSLSFGTDEMDMLLGDSFLRNSYTLFDYGSFSGDGSVVIKSPSVKMFALSSSDEDYPEFLTYRAKNLASLPAEATQAQLEKLIADSHDSSSGNESDDAVSNDANDSVSDDANVLSSAASSSSGDDSYQALVDKLDKFGPIALGLLGAIFVTLLGLLAVGITMCVRRGRSVGAARNVAPSYAPVPVRFKDSEYKDEEHTRYNE